MTQNIFLGSEIAQSPMTQARFSVLPVPFEKSVSYGGGTARGPQAIIDASHQLETLVVSEGGHAHPCEHGIHTCEAVSCDVEPEQVIARIASAVSKIIKAQSTPVMLGGEHSVTFGAVKGLLAVNIGDFGVVQFDAHADLREAYEGDPYSHASVMKRVVDAGVPLYQLGVRAFCDEEHAVRQQFSEQIYYRDAVDLVPNTIMSVTLPDDFPEQVYLSFDVDGLDPSIMPATGTPVQGGLGWYQSLSLIESIAKQRKIIGFDVVELAPITGFQAYDFAVAQLTYQIMDVVQRHS